MTSLSDVANPANRKLEPVEPLGGRAIPIDTFRWIVTGLLTALVAAAGWFLGGIQADLREMRKDVAGIRLDAAVVATKLEGLIAEARLRNPH